MTEELLIHKEHPETRGKSPLELASHGYKVSAREEARRKKPVQIPLSAIGAKIGSEWSELINQPPDRTERAYLEPGMQRLLDSLTFANKGLESIEKLEGEMRQTQKEVYDAVYRKDPEMVKQKEETLKMQERTLASISSNIDEAVRFANNIQKHSPEKIAAAKSMLGKLRTKVTLPYSYQDAEDNLPPHANVAVDYLEKIRKGGNQDELHGYNKTLREAGIEPQDIFKQVQSYTMSPTDQAVAELRESEGQRHGSETQNKGD